MDQLTSMSAYVKVVEKQSFTNAAQALNTTPSKISKQITWLEEHLGAKLLQRTTRRISLTEIGSIYYEQCTQILKGIENSENIIKFAQREVQGTLKVNAPLSFGITHLSKAVAEFSNKYPKVNIELYLSDDHNDIIKQGFDLGIRVTYSFADSSLVVRELSKGFQVRPCASPQYLRTNGTPLHPKELTHHNCLIYTNQKNDLHHWYFKGPEGEENIKVNGTIRTNNILFLREAVLRGVGIAMMGSYTYLEDCKRGDLRLLFDDYEPLQPKIYGIYSSREYLPLKISTFLTFLKEWFAGNLDL